MLGFVFRACATNLQFEFAFDSNKSFGMVPNFDVTALNWKCAPRVAAVSEVNPTLVEGCWEIAVDGRRSLIRSNCFLAFESLKSQGPFHPDAVENVMMLLLSIPDSSWFKLASWDVFDRCKGFNQERRRSFLCCLQAITSFSLVGGKDQGHKRRICFQALSSESGVQSSHKRFSREELAVSHAQRSCS
jgi:hypothetical protein